MSESFQDLIQRLGVAINDAITNNEGIDAALADVRESGIDVFLVLEATIVVRPRTEEAGAAIDAGVEAIEADQVPALQITPEDKNFLKRLRISVDVGDDDVDVDE